MNDFTRHFGDFEKVRPEDDPDLAAEKARQLQDDANGDLHMGSTPLPGVKSEIEVGPTEAGTEEYKGGSGDVFDAVHTTQEALLRVNAGSTNVSKDPDQKARQDKDDKRNDNSVMRFIAASGFPGLTGAQAIAYNNFADLIQQRQQAAEEIVAAENAVEATIAANATILATGTDEERLAATEAIYDTLDTLSIRNMEQERLDAQVLPELGNLAQQFGADTAPAGSEFASEMTAAEIQQAGTTFLLADQDDIDPDSIAALPVPVQRLLIETRFPGALEGLPADSEMSPVEFLQSQMETNAAPAPAEAVSLQCDAEPSDVELRATEIIAESRGMTVEQVQMERLMSGLPGASEPVVTADADPLLGNNGGLTALEQPRDHATTAAYMGYDGQERTLVGYDGQNGVLADGAFCEACSLPTPTDPMLTPTDPMLGVNDPTANSQPLPGTPEHMELRMRDPLLAAGGL